MRFLIPIFVVFMSVAVGWKLWETEKILDRNRQEFLRRLSKVEIDVEALKIRVNQLGIAVYKLKETTDQGFGSIQCPEDYRPTGFSAGYIDPKTGRSTTTEYKQWCRSKSNPSGNTIE